MRPAVPMRKMRPFDSAQKSDLTLETNWGVGAQQQTGHEGTRTHTGEGSSQ